MSERRPRETARPAAIATETAPKTRSAPTLFLHYPARQPPRQLAQRIQMLTGGPAVYKHGGALHQTSI
jgi:hypothetical protein